MTSEVFFLSFKGTPEFVTISECVHYFEWRTYAACRRDKFKPHKEVSKGDDSSLRALTWRKVFVCVCVCGAVSVVLSLRKN